MAKVTVVAQFSEEMDNALLAFAEARDTSKADVIRRAVAAWIEYDLDAEPSSERRRKYATIAERNEAMKQRAKEKREINKQLLRAIELGEREETIRALAASLKRRED